jgi:O-antigen/teichoic acid export membrane protein
MLVARLRSIIPDKPSDSVLQGVFFTSFSYLFVQATRFVSNLILTRLLAPEMFGLMAIVYTLVAGLQMFSDLGLHTNFIRKQTAITESFIDTAWSIQIVRGFGIGVLVIFAAITIKICQAAHWIQPTSALSEPLLIYALLIVAAIPIVEGFESMQVAIARKSMRLGVLTYIEVISHIVATLTMLGLAWQFQHVLILPTSWLIGALAKLVLTHRKLPMTRLRFAFDRNASLEILGFAKWVIPSTILSFCISQSDKLILSTLESASILGFYSLASMLVMVGQSGCSKMINQVVLPKLSVSYKAGEKMLRDDVSSFLRWLDLPLVVSAAVLCLGGRLIVGLIYDPRYALAGEILAILGASLCAARYEVFEQLIRIRGPQPLVVMMNLVRAITLAAGIVLGHAFFGFHGSLWLIVASYFSTVPVAIYWAHKNKVVSVTYELLYLTVIFALIAVSIKTGDRVLL